jgi:hypothetical protein
VNKVWTVQSSTSVAAGTLYVFLEEGTLIITGRNSRPAVGTWTYKDRSLVMVEDAIPYRVETLHLSRDEFRIRSHNPGEPVELTLVPAATPSGEP